MKKFFNSFVVMALALTASFSLTACGDDDPDAPEKEKTIKEAVLTTTLYVNQDVIDALDIVGKSSLGQNLSFASKPVDVLIGSGQTMSMYPMILQGTSKTVPLTSIMEVTFTIKEGYELPEDNEFAISVIAEGSIIYSDASQDTYASSGHSVHNKGIFADKLKDYTDNLNKRFGRIEVTLETSGIEID